MIKVGIERGLGETWEIEMWRERYFFQAILVCLIAGTGLILGGIYIENLWVMSFLCLFEFLVVYLMIYEIYCSLQDTAHNIILNKSKKSFGDVLFTYDEGLDNKEFAKFKNVGDFIFRECKNGIRGANWWIIEECAGGYGNKDLKLGRKNVFEGMLLVFNDVKSFKGDAKIILKDGKFILGINSDSTYDNSDFRVFMLRIMKFFSARNAWCEIKDGKLYIGISTKEKLYSKFSLIKQNRSDTLKARIANIIDIMDKF